MLHYHYHRQYCHTNIPKTYFTHMYLLTECSTISLNNLWNNNQMLLAYYSHRVTFRQPLLVSVKTRNLIRKGIHVQKVKYVSFKWSVWHKYRPRWGQGKISDKYFKRERLKSELRKHSTFQSKLNSIMEFAVNIFWYEEIYLYAQYYVVSAWRLFFACKLIYKLEISIIESAENFHLT